MHMTGGVRDLAGSLELWTIRGRTRPSAQAVEVEDLWPSCCRVAYGRSGGPEPVAGEMHDFAQPGISVITSPPGTGLPASC